MPFNIKTQISKLENYLEPTDELIESNNWRNGDYRLKR